MIENLPENAVGLRLCKMIGERLVVSEVILFAKGRVAVDTTLRRAAISGKVGPMGETGDYWADIFVDENTWVDTIALDRNSWNSLKNRWMRCRMENAE